MSNPLLDKFYELHPEKKENNKVKLSGEIQLSQEFLDALENHSKSVSVSIPNNSSNVTATEALAKKQFKTYDPSSVRDMFFQIADLIQNDRAIIQDAQIKFESDFLGRPLQTVEFRIQYWDT